mmetsp:Transcript_10651/g.31507  ORF Transcript_10651/g.31507 Transcript_10651/m.31507 type:complete len:270 (-) Transcript_10651:318-1127(-)
MSELASNTAAANVVVDPFLSSMTFATGVQRDCDCDECGLCGGLDTPAGRPAGMSAIGAGVPPDVAEYIREHKKSKLASGPVTRRQERVLVARADGASVYRLTIPPGADPLVEFGNSHRIVVVDRLKKCSRVKSIGKGIVGSSDEEKARKTVGWEEGKAYLMPCNGGRALGWVNENTEEKERKGDEGGNVVLFMVKITPEAMEDIPEYKEFTDKWVCDVLHIFQQNLKSRKEGKSTDQGSNDDCRLTPLRNSNYDTLKGLIPPLLASKGL